jgi:hypothetical protein
MELNVLEEVGCATATMTVVIIQMNSLITVQTVPRQDLGDLGDHEQLGDHGDLGDQGLQFHLRVDLTSSVVITEEDALD